jgi:hypothetical protein
MKSHRFIETFTLAALAFGIGQACPAAWEQATEAAAVEGGQLLRVQDRGGPHATFRGRPEFPPPGYLAEFEESFDERRQHESRDGIGTTLPGRPGMPPAPQPPKPPEYAPRTLGAPAFGSRSGQGTLPPRAPEATGDGREPQGRRPTWAQPPATPARERPRYGEMPGPTPGAGLRRDDFPANETRRSPPSAPAGGYEHQWPSTPSASGRYQTHPEFRPDTWDRSRPAGAAERFRSPPEFPGSGLEWQR